MLFLLLFFVKISHLEVRKNIKLNEKHLKKKKRQTNQIEKVQQKYKQMIVFCVSYVEEKKPRNK